MSLLARLLEKVIYLFFVYHEQYLNFCLYVPIVKGSQSTHIFKRDQVSIQLILSYNILVTINTNSLFSKLSSSVLQVNFYSRQYQATYCQYFFYFQKAKYVFEVKSLNLLLKSCCNLLRFCRTRKGL